MHTRRQSTHGVYIWLGACAREKGGREKGGREGRRVGGRQAGVTGGGGGRLGAIYEAPSRHEARLLGRGSADKQIINLVVVDLRRETARARIGSSIHNPQCLKKRAECMPQK